MATFWTPLSTFFILSCWTIAAGELAEYNECRFPGTDYSGGESMGQVILDTVEQCVEHCIQLPECIALTFVSPNPGQYGSDIEGCWLKSGGWTVNFGEAFQANMVSVDVNCVRAIRVDGEWSDDDEWGACSEECGTGTQTRTRTCTNPAPAHGGADCDGEGTDTQACNEDPCPEEDEENEEDCAATFSCKYSQATALSSASAILAALVAASMLLGL